MAGGEPADLVERRQVPDGGQRTDAGDGHEPPADRVDLGQRGELLGQRGDLGADRRDDDELGLDVLGQAELRGVYEVEPSAGARWRSMVIGDSGTVYLRDNEPEPRSFRAKVEPEKQTLTLSTRMGNGGPGGVQLAVLTYARPDPEHLILQGSFENEPLSLRFRRLPDRELPLMSRGFHWVSEFPINR